MTGRPEQNKSPQLGDIERWKLTTFQHTLAEVGFAFRTLLVSSSLSPPAIICEVFFGCC